MPEKEKSEKPKPIQSGDEVVYVWGDASHAQDLLMPSIDAADEIIEWPPRDKPVVVYAPPLARPEMAYPLGYSGSATYPSSAMMFSGVWSYPRSAGMSGFAPFNQGYIE